MAPLLLDDLARILAAGRVSAATAPWCCWRSAAASLAALRIGGIAHKPGVGLHMRAASSKTD